MIYADRVKEETTTTGTGTLSLSGAPGGYQTFVAGAGSGATVYYCVVGGSEWEVGSGTVTDASPDTLSRVTVLASSNAGSLVNFSAGTKEVMLVAPATVFRHLTTSPDTPPDSPNAMDDEFISDKGPSGTALWAWRNQGSASYSYVNGALVMQSDQKSTENLRIFEQSISGSFVFRCKMAPAYRYDTNYHRTFFGVLRNSDGRAIIHTVGRVTSYSSYNIEKYTAVGTWSSRPLAMPTARYPSYFEVESDGTNIIFRTSDTGHKYITQFSETIATFVGTADRVIIGVNDSTNLSPAGAGVFEWFRRIS